MKNLNFLKLFFGTMLLIATTAFVSCVDDNDDTEAPYLEVSPTNLIFTTDGTPAEGSQSSFEISTNRHWTATVKDDKSWVTLSATEGDGSATIQVSIPENINDEASIEIQISNKVGPLMTETVKIKSGNIKPSVLIYKETFGVGEPKSDGKWYYVDEYTGWDKSGNGSTNVEYEGTGASIRNNGSTSTGYEGASGKGKLFFGANPSFIVKKITLAEEQTDLMLTFGSVYYEFNSKDNEFKPDLLHFFVSADGSTWSNALTFTTKDASDSWVFVTSNFTLKNPSSTLYIKFIVDQASVFSIDDVTLATGQGGQEIDLENGSVPTVFTADATNTTETTATVGGSIANIDPSALTEVGVQYTEFSTGTVTDIDWTKVAKTKATTTATPWTVALTNLTKDTQYAFRAYAVTASGDIYGEPKTFVAMETTYTQISIGDLVKKMTSGSAAVPVDQDYVIEGIVCGDPAGKNYSYGTLYLMTEGTKTAGNALSIYNNKIDVTQYSLGDKLRVNLQKGVAGIYKRYDVPQVEGFSVTDIEKVSSGNLVEPIELTSIDQLTSYVCMPVTVKNVTIETAGIWKEKTDAASTHTFKVNGSSLTVYINKGATSFDGKPYTNGSKPITGIVSIFKSNGQLMPRNLDDVKAFDSTEPAITSVSPTVVSFPSTGGTKEITVNVINQGSSVITTTGLDGILESNVNGTTVTVKANENTSTNAVTQTLTISLSGANSVTVPVTVAGVSSGNETTLTMTSAQIVEKKSGDLALNNSGYGSQAVATPSTWYTWNDGGIEFAGARLMIGKTSESIIGMIQMQGHASTATNQGLITNNTPLGKIKSITLSLGDSSSESYQYTPAFTVYGGTEANALTTAITESGNKFNPTFDFSGGNFSHFTIKNDKTGALYISKITVVYEK